MKKGLLFIIILIFSSIDLSYGTENGIWSLAESGSLNELKNLVENIKVNVNATDKEGKTALHYAAFANQTNIIYYLISKKATVDAKDDDKNTPLFYALEKGNLQAVEVLIKNKASLKNKYNDKTYYEYFIENYSYYYESDLNPNYILISRIIAKAINASKSIKINTLNEAVILGTQKDIESQIKKGYMPAKNTVYVCLILGDINVLKYFQKKNIIPELDTPTWIYAFMRYEKTKILDSCCFLVENKINSENIIEINNEEFSPFGYSIYLDSIDLFKLFLTNGINIEQPCYYEKSPLLYCIELNRVSLIELLIENGVDINKTASDKNKTLNPLIETIRIKHNIIANLLIQNGCNVKAVLYKDGWNYSIIGYAIEINNYEVIQSLIKVGVNINDYCKYEGTAEYTPLGVAILKEDYKLINELIENGANLNSFCISGHTPLTCSVTQKDVNMTAFLIEKGADINKPNEWSYTPLAFAIETGNLDIFYLLIKNNVDVNKKWTTIYGQIMSPLGDAYSLKSYFGESSTIYSTMVDELKKAGAKYYE
ncbi:MAG: hypothetical protein HPY53_16310 [Brevinematales bacterium]|nr:hypothetical protein [Brevinematales bacterium]